MTDEEFKKLGERIVRDHAAFMDEFIARIKAASEKQWAERGTNQDQVSEP